MNIAIIGGSITEGAGANEYSKSYVYMLEEYLREKYKDVNVKNLGSAGTASNFGLFRLKRDLGDFKPDVIFIEFAVNDRIYNSIDSSIYFEGLLRECTKFTEKIVIVDLPTGMCDSCTNIHKKFAYFYDIPLIDVQDEVWKKIGKRELTWTKISVDNLHPNDRGHELYFEIIKNNLEYVDFNNLKVNMDFRVLSKYKFKSPIIVPYDSAQVEYYGDWHENDFDLNCKFNFGAVTNSVGNGVIFKFKGKHLSMMNLLSDESGILECKLDDYVFNIDLYMESKGYFNTTINSYNLDNGEHTLTMIVSDKKNENSLGNKVVIGGFLIDPGI